ncbi:MAG: substrate-binding domain-containing protein [Firmicutes bacterium]|nr:substrate-binding domain-containing protein [Bacillota bacterium]
MDQSNHWKKSRRSIGVLTDWVGSLYQANLLRGIFDYARDQGINVLCFEGGAINPVREYESSRNIIYDLVGRENVDGLIVFSAAIGHFCTLEQIKDFLLTYAEIPIVSIGAEIEGIPSIMVDNAKGLRELLVHLIKRHACRRFAFITGPKENQDSRKRFSVFCQTLQEYGLSFDQTLVAEGDFTLEGGRAAACELIAKGVIDKADAVVAANDVMALGTIMELRRKGVSIPQEIAVVGFDNTEESLYCSPLLTTVSQPLYQQGWLAAETLLKIMDGGNGEEILQRVVIPTKPVFRESCGCFSEMTISAGNGRIDGKGLPTPDSFTRHKEEIISGIVESAVSRSEVKEAAGEKRLQKLLDALEQQLQISARKDQPFLRMCFTLLDEALWAGEDVFSWQVLLSELRRYLLPYVANTGLCRELENLCHQVRVMIGEKALLKERIKYYDLIQTEKTLDLLREEILTASELPQLLEVLAQRLPELGVTSCYFSEYYGARTPDDGDSRLILAYNEEGRVKLEVDHPIIFKTRHLIPPQLDFQDKQRSFIVTPLCFSQTQFGLALYEFADGLNESLYSSLHRMICSALQGVLLTKELKMREIELIVQREHLRNLAELREIMEGFIETISVTVEKRDPYTAGHQKRVALLAREIAKEMGLSREEIEAVRMAGIVHDLGKIYVPAEILNKPGRLHELEFNLIKTHPQMGYDILRVVDFPWPLADIVLQHHERLDGSGYPLGRKEKDILPAAKILAVADVVEAMASHRPYRPALSIEEALAEIKKNRGILYDPAAVDACLRLFARGYSL